MTVSSPALEPLCAVMRERIRSGAWAAGEPLPSERALRRELGVPLPLLRRALLTLRREGLIVGGGESAPQVHQVVPSRPLDGVASFSQWATLAGMRPGQRILWVGEREATGDIAQHLQAWHGEPVVEVMRVRTLDGRPAVMERSWFPHHVGEGLLHTPLDGVSVHEFLTREGFAPARMRHTIDAIPAHPLDAEHLHIERGLPLLRSKRVSFAADGSELGFADERYLPHVTTLMSDTQVHHTSRKETVHDSTRCV